MTKNLSVIAFLMGAFSINFASAAVWQETQSWTPEWEQQYSDWVRDGFNEDMFTSGPYRDMSTDCADAVYMARIIFAFENKLPFVIKDSTGGTNRLTNQMSRFDSTANQIQRVRKFMVYVGDVTSTKSLPNDTYPVTISRDFVRPGTVWSRPRITKSNIWDRITGRTVTEDPGHAELVKEVADTGAIHLIGSTVPKAIRKMNTTSSLVFMPVETTTGFRNWMLPEYYSQNLNSLPGYSLEQFQSVGRGTNDNRTLNLWVADVQNRLALRTETKGENVSRQLGNVCNLVKTRVDIIAKSEQRRVQLGGACMDAADYDAYSTPSRDKRIVTTLKQLSKNGGFGLSAKQRLKKLKPEFDVACPAIQIAPGQNISLYDFSIAVLGGDISSDPNDSFEARWGLAPSTSKCPKYE